MTYANRVESMLKIERTKTSPQDSQIGVLGEIAFANWLTGEWSWHDPTVRKGLVDFENSVEVKTSAFVWSQRLNLLVREDYASSRSPEFYVQVIIDMKSRVEKSIKTGMDMILCGYASHAEVKNAPLRDFGSKFGGLGGYRCHFIPVKDLHSMETLKKHLSQK